MRMSRWPVVLGLAVVLSVASGFAAPWVFAQAPLPITIGYQEAIDWPLFTAKSLKLFEKVGLMPAFEKLVAGAPVIAAAESKRIDVLTVGPVAFLLGLSRGVDRVMIGIPYEGAYAEGLVARRGGGIDRVGDLKGKRIGYVGESTAYYGLMMMLRQHGVPLDQVTLLHMSPTEQVAAMARRDIDAAMTWEPWIQRMVHDANAKIVAIEGDVGIYTNVGGYVASRDWLRDNRETAVRFLRAILMAHDVLQKDRAVGMNALAEEMGIKRMWAEAIYRAAPPPDIYQLADPRYRYSLIKGAGFHRRLGYVAAFLLEKKVIPEPVDLSDALDVSIFTEALRTWTKGQ